VEQLVTNLVDNALHYNVPGGRVDVVAEHRAGQAVLSVVNTGPSIPDEDVARLFQPFERGGAGRTSRSDGLGLGLSIVQAVATAHGALLNAAPRPNGGLAISVTFPPCDHGSARNIEITEPIWDIARGLTMSR
jgi:signal transduction histidine kinase